MASSYVNDLRLNEMATGDASGTWGETTNTNLELIAEAFSYGTEAITTNADTHTTTIADGATDPGRSMFLKYTGTLDSTCTITIGPNTVSKLWIIENGTSGSQSIIIKQGSGATVTIPSGKTKVIYSDGAGSGGAMVDAFASLNLQTSGIIETSSSIQTGLIEFTDGDDAMTIADGGGVTFAQTATFSDDIIIGDGKTIGSASDVDAMTIASNGQVTFSQTLIGTALDISGDIDVDGTTNLDIVDIDGAVDMATTLTLAGNADFNGDLDVDGTTNLDVVDIDGAVDMASTLAVGGVVTVIDGSTSAPSITNAGDANTGIYFPADDNFGIVVGGSRKLLVNSSGVTINNGVLDADGGITVDTMTLDGSTLTSTDDFIVDAASDINLDAAGGQVRLKGSGTTYVTFNVDATPEVLLAGGNSFIKTTTSDADLSFIGNDGGSDVTALTLDMSDAGTALFNNKVAIGTTSPASELHVMSGDLFLTANSTSADSGQALYFQSTTSGWATNVAHAAIQGKRTDASNGYLRFDTRGSGTTAERMRIDSAGAIQIGGTTNAGFVDFDSVSLQLNTQRNPNTGTFANTAKSHASIALRGADGGSDIRFGTASANNTASTERMRIDSSGKVGIGTDNPTSLLTLVGSSPMLRIDNTAETESGIQFRDSAATGSQLAEILYNASTKDLLFKVESSAERMRITNNGHVLIGTTSNQGVGGISFEHGASGFTVHNNTDATSAGFEFYVFRRSSSQIGSIAQSSTNAVTYNTSSDARLKDVTGASRGLDVINNLNPVSYNWKADNHADEGLIAQEVKELVPNAVSQTEDGYYQMDYSKLVTHLVKGMQEQQEQIETLKSEIANLKEN